MNDLDFLQGQDELVHGGVQSILVYRVGADQTDTIRVERVVSSE